MPARLSSQPGAFLLALVVCLLIIAPGAAAQSTAPRHLPPPNILWISSEDNGPQLGAYGDPLAHTPTLDALAARGITYTRTSSNAPVCSVARNTIITGMYPPSLGSHHHRSRITLPTDVLPFPHYLRSAGYYCSNNAKEDYNFKKPPGTWDQSDRKAHWRSRKPDQPFFAVFNIGVTHESRVWPRGDGSTTHDPKTISVPPYHPDDPVIRRDWAQYYDNLTTLDSRAAAILSELEEDGLTGSTIVFYFGDHGPGMPRGKRWLYQSGLHVPLIVHIPDTYQYLASAAPASRSDRLVGFIDLAPTTLSLAGVAIPAHMQGRAFLGEQTAPAAPYSFGYRDRMDERYDMSRSVHDGTYKYIRNYFPHRPQSQYLAYQYRNPTMRCWQSFYNAGALTDAQAAFFRPKLPEELYDTLADPHEVNNLAGDPEHREALARLRAAHRAWILSVRDLGFLPEDELRSRAAPGSEHALGLDPERYPLERIFAAAELASTPSATIDDLVALLDDDDSAVRYWAIIGLIIKGAAASPARDALAKHLTDPAPSVRIAAAHALASLGDLDAALPVLAAALQHDQLEVRLQAAIVADELDEGARPLIPDMTRAAKAEANIPGGGNSWYIQRVVEKALADLDQPPRDDSTSTNTTSERPQPQPDAP